MNFRACLFAVLTLAAVWLGAYTWLLQSRLHVLHTARTEEYRLKEQFRLQAYAVRSPEQLRREQAALQLSSASMDRILPADASVPDVIDALNRAAAKHNLILSSFTPLPPEPLNGLTALSFDISTEGSYPALRAFVGDIAGLPRTTTLSRLHLKMQNGGNLSFEARATVYASAADGIEQEDGH